MNVNAVVEVDKPGEIVDSGLLVGFARSKAFPDRRQCRTVGPNLGMTIHTSFRENYPSTTTIAGLRAVVSLQATPSPWGKNLLRRGNAQRLYPGGDSVWNSQFF